MSINLNTKCHCSFNLIPYGGKEPMPLSVYVQGFKRNSELIRRTDNVTMSNQFVDIVNAARIAKDLNIAEHIDLMCYMIGVGFYNGKLRKLLEDFHITVEKLDSVRAGHIEEYMKGVPVFRKEPILIDLNPYCKMREAKAIPPGFFEAWTIMHNARLLKILDEWEDQQHPERTLIPEDEWYPDDYPTKKIVEQDADPDYSFVVENDNDHFLDLSEKKEPETEVVQVLPNKQKLVKLRKSDGNVHYVVVGEDIDVARLPKIYNMFLREELAMGCNITTDRLTRILKIQEMLEIGFTKAEIAEYLNIPKYIVYSDMSILKNIEMQVNAAD